MSDLQNRIIRTTPDLEAACARIQTDGLLSLDTEFVWRNTYYPQLGIVQFGNASDFFSDWLDAHWGNVPNVRGLVRQSPLFLAQMEHLQVGIELFLKLAKIEFVKTGLADAVERTGGNRFAKKVHFSTNMKILGDMIAIYQPTAIAQFIAKWLTGQDDNAIGAAIKALLLSFTEECQYKIRTTTGEVFFQQDGVYARLRETRDNTVESLDIHEPVGPFRILKSYIKEGMHPYITDGENGFSLNSSAPKFALYADMVHTTLELTPKRTIVYQEVQSQLETSATPLTDIPRQLIIYGAPGTGKSWRIKMDTAGGDVIRMTFHPDSDYSTFVGAYKPSMEDDGFKTVVTTGEVSPSGSIAKKDGLITQKRIVYKFVAQAFLKAYVAAWKRMVMGGTLAENAERAEGRPASANAACAGRENTDATERVPPVYLVIEEINRGNCAQIFGDLFQLLDRSDEGFSEYEIAADDDLRRYLAEAFRDVKGADATARVPPEVAGKLERVLKGEILLLPPNLCIWATMNTSDQSLFPIDSAFKRRWEWKYMPIHDAQKGYRIAVGADAYDWWDFLDKANAVVQDFTDSEDKKLGYFFCKANPDGTIPLERFVGKVVFYLWNDVFRDVGFDHEVFADGKGGRLLFKSFFNSDGSPKAEAVRQFLENLGVGVVASSAGNAEGSDEGATTEPPAGGAENVEGQGR